MAGFKNATPRAYFPGFDDQSARALLPEAEQIPQHLPFAYIQSARGPLVPLLVAGNTLLKNYGDKTFDVRGKFMNHQVKALQTSLGAGNAGVLVKRVVAPNASTAKLILGVETVTAEIPVYQRDANMNILRDVNGEKLVDSGAPAITGKKLRVVLMSSAGVTDISTIANTVGTLTGAVGEVSSIRPILALETFHGSDYNNMGVRFSAPVTGSDAVSKAVIADQKAMLYRAAMVERSVTGTVLAINSVRTEKSIDFALKEGVFDRKTNLDLNAERLVDSYQDLTLGREPMYGPFASMHVYYENIQEICEEIFATESVETHIDGLTADMINILTGIAHDGTHHYTVELDDTSLMLDGNTTVFATGGEDGDVGITVLENLIIDEMNSNWNNPEYDLTDMRKYPMSDIYDTGFGMDTKMALVKALGYRPDVKVHLSTQDLKEAPNTITQESSITAVLDAHVALFPESAANGTGACRATINGHQGVRVNNAYKKPLTLVDDLVAKRSAYQGAGDGKMKTAFVYDRFPGNTITGFDKINNPSKPMSVREEDWDAGLNYVQWADRNTLFRPALQTVYKNDTSILNSLLVVDIMCDVTKLLNVVWVEHTGRSDLTNGELAQSCVTRFNELSAGRYDGRVILEPVCYVTPADEARGYSWTMDVAVYGNNMKTVGTFNVIARRQSDLNG